MSTDRNVFVFQDMQYHMGFSRYPNHTLVIMLVPVDEESGLPNIEVTTCQQDLYIDYNREALIAGNPKGLIQFLKKYDMIKNEVKMIVATAEEGPECPEILTVARLAYCPVECYYECSYCGKGGPNMQRCSQCKLMYYCNKDHQRKDWAEHREECQQFIRDMHTPIELMESSG